MREQRDHEDTHGDATVSSAGTSADVGDALDLVGGDVQAGAAPARARR